LAKVAYVSLGDRPIATGELDVESSACCCNIDVAAADTLTLLTKLGGASGDTLTITVKAG